MKKAKNEQLYSRQQILMNYGIRSGQRITIDEEINTIIKGMDYDYKRLKSLLLGFQEKRGDDINSPEYKEREAIAELLREANSMFQQAFQDQTRRFEMNKGNAHLKDVNDIDLDEYLHSVANKLEMLEKRDLLNAEGNFEFDSNFGLLQLVYLPNNQTSLGASDNILGQ